LELLFASIDLIHLF